MKDEVLSSLGAQNMDTCRYPVSDLNDFDFYWESDQLDVHAVLTLGIDTPFANTV